MPSTKIQAIVDFGFRDETLTKGSGLRNMYLTTDEGGEPLAIKRPALRTSETVGFQDMPAVADQPVHGIHARKNVLEIVAPVNWSSNAQIAADGVQKVLANMYGQFVGGGNAIWYAEKNNANNWNLGQAFGTASNRVNGITFSYTDDQWVVLESDGGIWYADKDDLTSWSAGTDCGLTTGYALFYSPSNALYIAVGTDGATDEIYTSPDLATWTVRANPSGVTLYGITGNSSISVAVGASGEWVYSGNGTTWTQGTSVGTDAYRDIAVKMTGGTDVWVAVGDNGKIMRAVSNSPSGSDFSAVTSGTANDLRSVYAVQDETHSIAVDFIAVGDSGTIVYSTDNGATWNDATFAETSPGLSYSCIAPSAVLEAPDASGITQIHPESRGFVAYYQDANDLLQSHTSLDGQHWFVGDRYDQVYRMEGETVVCRDRGDNNTYTENLDFDISGYNNVNLSLNDLYNKAYFAEMITGNATVLAMMVPGDGVYHSPANSFGNGGMAFVINNSRPIYFHGYGGPNGDTSIMTYPFNYIKDIEEYLVHGIVQLDGYFFIMTNQGFIYHCAAGDYRTWPALNRISADLEGDEGRGISKHNNQILAFGEYTTEVFYNANNPIGSVLQRREDVRYEVGLAGPNSMCEWRDKTVFVGQNKTLNKGVYIIDNFRLKKISNTWIDNLLNNYVNWQYSFQDAVKFRNCFATVAEFNENAFYILTVNGSTSIGNDTLTMVYDLKADKWYHWYVDARSTTNTWSTDSGTIDIFDALDFDMSADGYPHILMSDGTPYIFDKDLNYDYGSNAIECQWVSAQMEYKEIPTKRRKRFKNVYVTADKGISTQDNVTCTLEWSDDDYSSWGGNQTIELKAHDFPVLHSCGMGRRRAWRLSHSDINSDFRFNGIEVDFEVMKW